MAQWVIKHLTDYGLTETAWDLIQEEDKRQLEKWGEQDHSLAEWLMFLTEEVGELSAAMSEYCFRDGALEDIKLEAVQVATLAIKIAYMIECVL